MSKAVKKGCVGPSCQWYPQEFLIYITLRGLSDAEVGQLVRKVCTHLMNSEWGEVKAYPFVGKIWKGNQRDRLPESTKHFVFERDGRLCRSCGSTDNLQIDHIKPWADGGRHEPGNLQVLCSKCNRAKGPHRGKHNRGGYGR